MQRDPTTGPESPTILVVDDVAENLAALADVLEEHGCNVVVARNGDDALERAAHVRPDLILLDVVMPGMDGFETCRALKGRAETRETPVIFMTALADTHDKLAGFEAGAVDYVTKPLDGAEVLARVRTHVLMSQLRRTLVERNEHLQQEIAAHEQTQQALQRSNLELEQLAYVASHDMQEPLRMIASYLQLIVQRYDHQLDSDGREFIAYAVDGAKRMQDLINDLLTYSRVGTKARAFQATACSAVVATAINHLHVAVAESGAKIVVDELPEISADAPQLVQLFQNLIANAIKFRGDKPPRVSVGCEARDGEWEFFVRDNGIGIAPDYFERIFLLFQRLHTRRQYPGTGIGLALCKKIVERHGGRIWVESTQGQGAVFRFTIPRQREAA